MVATWHPHGPLAEREQLYFLHIPKTAGTAMRTYLESQFDAADVCPHLDMHTILPERPSALAQYRLICGHHGSYLPQLLGREPVTMTIMRDPVARSVSHFRHLKSCGQHWLSERVEGASFEDFVCGEFGAPELLNFQTRFLALRDIQADHFGHSALRLGDADGLVAKYTDPALYDAARRRLDDMAFVGIQERFGDLLMLLAYTFGWSPVSDFPRFNRARTPFDESQLTPRALERVHEYTRIDRAVYEHAKGLFDTRVGGITPGDVEAQFREVMAAKPRMTEVHYSFDKALLGSNWHPRERRGTARWSGPGTSTTIDLPLAIDRPLRLRFFAGSQTPDVIESLRVFANDVELDLRWWQMHDPAIAQRTFETLLTPDVLMLNPAYCNLRFEVDRVVIPSQEWPDRTDDRRLALYFFWLEIDPAAVGVMAGGFCGQPNSRCAVRG